MAPPSLTLRSFGSDCLCVGGLRGRRAVKGRTHGQGAPLPHAVGDALDFVRCRTDGAVLIH